MQELQAVVTEKWQIQSNFEDVQRQLVETLDTYKGVIVTEDTISNAKKDVAGLRKIKTSIEDARKAVKKEWEVPYKEFEEKCKKLTKLVDDTIEPINKQLSDYELERVLKKNEHLHELYKENIGEYEEYISFDQVYKKQWDNVSYKDSDVIYDISEAVTKVRSDIDIIKSLGSEIEEECLAAYKRAGNELKAAIQKNNDYNAAKKLAEEKVKEEAARKVEEVHVEAPIEVVETVEEAAVELPKTEGKDVIYFKVTGAENIQMIRDFCGLNGIDVEEIPG